MKVMSAGMHYTRRFGRERKTGVFRQRKSIHVGAKRDRPGWISLIRRFPVQNAHDSCADRAHDRDGK